MSISANQAEPTNSEASEPTTLPGTILLTDETEGVFCNIPAESYHTAPGVSHSMLKHMEPPARLPAYLEDDEESTPTQMLGTLAHALVLTPNEPLPNIAVKPSDMKFTTREGREWRDAQLAAGKLIIKESDAAALYGMAKSISEHPCCNAILRSGWSEVSIFKRFYSADLRRWCLRRSRLDFVPEHGNALVDVKTCMDASLEEFSKSILNYGYHTQAAYYLDIWNDSHEHDQRECFIFIAVEKEPPYLVSVYNLDARAIEAGRRLNHQRLMSYMDCKESGVWPGYPLTVQNIDLPRWAYPKEPTNAWTPFNPS